MVAAEYKTNHHFGILYAAARSPDVKMSESKVQLQMVNVKYNYFRLHALLLPVYDANFITRLLYKDSY